ncbi:HRD1 like membrane associated RING finger containing protein [Cryptosporidium canis]|uniref:RING-type E3 ubiquitin transferase n=1 Tax=Cryptosporidium canis TaxID=195482 RepID=A0ABQ8PBM7_9CRYT|nr:HRD1 like membrane associated RING finger containing protein [Cryptosporidium canis]
MIITNAGLLALYFFGKLVLNMFVGRLRDIELEEIFDQGRMFLLDTIFFLLFSSPTIDNVEVGAMVLSRYITFILVLKLLHLISHIRMNHMFELDRPKTITIIRMAALLNILLVIDISLVFKYYAMLSKESTLRLWVFFESVSLFVSCITSIGKYLVHSVDLKLQAVQQATRQQDEPSEQDNTDSSGIHTHNFVWSNKNAILFYMEVFGDICSLITYLLFIILFLVLNPSRIPLYIMGDIFHVLKALHSKLSSFRRYRKLTKNIETRLQDATLEEIERIDTCIVCRDTLYIGSKKIPCGHVFHLDCLKSWFIQQQTCPICRSPITIQDEESESPAPITESSSSTELHESHETNTATEESERPDNNGVTLNQESSNSSTSLSSTSNVGEVENSATLNHLNSSESSACRVQNILSNWLVSEHKAPNAEKYAPVKFGNDLKGTKLKTSNHCLFKINRRAAIRKHYKTNNEDHIDTLPPQILALQPQLLLELNQTFDQKATRGEFEGEDLSEMMSEIYKKNAEIWMNKIRELLVTKDQSCMHLSAHDQKIIDDHIKGDAVSNNYEGRNCRTDPLRNLLEAVNIQLAEGP